MTRLLKQFVNEEDGAGMVEYGLLVALIGVALIAVTSYLAGGVWNVFASAGTELGDLPAGGDTSGAPASPYTAPSP